MNKFLPALECNQSSEWQKFPAAGPWLLKQLLGHIVLGSCGWVVSISHSTKDSEQWESAWSMHCLFQEQTALKGDENSCIISVPASISPLVGQPETKNLSGSLLSQNIWYNQREHKMRFFSQNLQINWCVAFARTCWESHNSLAGFLFFNEV